MIKTRLRSVVALSAVGALVSLGLAVAPAAAKSSVNYLPYVTNIGIAPGGSDLNPIAMGGSSFDAPFIAPVLNHFYTATQASSVSGDPANAAAWFYGGGTGFSSKTCDATGQYISENSLFGRALAIGATAESALPACFNSGTGDNGEGVIGFSDVPVNQDTAASPTDATLFSDAVTSGQSISNLVTVPVTLGGVALVYNNSFKAGTPSGCSGALKKFGLRLSGTTIAGIFAGNVTTWNAAAIETDNPHLTVNIKATKTTKAHTEDCLGDLSTETLTPVVRTADSGTTFMFGTYLHSVDPTDFATVPATLSCGDCDNGGGTNTNSTNLVTTLNGTNGGLGYVESSYYAVNKATLKVVSVINAAGAARPPSTTYVSHDAKFALGSSGTITAAGGFNTTSLANFSIANEDCGKCYPISGFSYAIVQKTQVSKGAALAISKFLYYLSNGGSATGGQQYAPALDYVILPTVIQTAATAAIQTITWTGNTTDTPPLSTSNT